MATRKPTGEQTGFNFGRDTSPPAELWDRPAPDTDAEPIAAVPPPTSTPAATGPKIYRVDELVRAANRTLEAKFSVVWVEGEISNLSQPRSGHVYFTLKDEGAQLPCVMFRAAAGRCKFQLADGQSLRVRGKLGIFDQQGKLQLYVEECEPVGLGAAQLAFEQLRAKLAAEGLFDAARKQRLPGWPRTVGIVTSPTGAAVRDMLRVAERRGRVRLLIAPCQVQGAAAPFEIVAALRLLQAQPGVDVIILGRGGGSSEDLAAFNDEGLARAIAACPIPIVSAVGHEVDFTIADFVADVRAPTPSAAAELVVPLFAAARDAFEGEVERLGRSIRRRLGDARQRLDATLDRGTVATQRTLQRRRQELLGLDRRLRQRHPSEQLRAWKQLLRGLQQRLVTAGPERAIALRARREMVKHLAQRLAQQMQRQTNGARRDFAETVGKLSSLSPLAVLERGYAVATTPAGHVVTSVTEVGAGDPLRVRVRDGQLKVRVEGSEG